jgi:hypothetical protein
MRLFGNAQRTVMVTAMCPEARAADVGPALEATARTARWSRSPADADPLAGLPYRVEPPGLQLAQRMGAVLAFTRDGRMPVADPADPIWVVGRSHSAVGIDDPSAFARRRLQQTATVKGATVQDEREVSIDGLPGIELIASATDAQTGAPVTVHQVLLVDAQGQAYYLLQGIVGAGQAARDVELFRAAAQTFRRR